MEVREADNLTILSLKKLRKEFARMVGDMDEGSMGGVLRERRDCNVDQSFLG